jgi:hypothetical protein
MNAMLDPKIVATSTQRPAAFEQGRPAGLDSTQGLIARQADKSGHGGCLSG